MTHIMIDLEMNKVKHQANEEGNRISNEIIEIGAVKMNDKFEVIDKFQSYVKPEYATISPVITRITKITDETVKDAPKLLDAMESFVKWIGEDDVTYYSWSMTDLRQFRSELTYKNMYLDILKKMENNWVDFQAEYSELLNIKRSIKLKDAVSSADYKFTGAPHTALADAVNTAEILILSKNKEKFQKVMKPVIDLFKPYSGGNTLGAMCADFFDDYKPESE
ncbi:MAG: exonuclease domain-containing protein [Lachnospiraceae bacterium]|nr:exonuclease domain-containing protein [Lachnospiraceae bacterium]